MTTQYITTRPPPLVIPESTLTTRLTPRKNYIHIPSTHDQGVGPGPIVHTDTGDFSGGDYQVVEKDYGDRKVIYHIPIEYADQYDLENIDETTFEQPIFHPPQTTIIHPQPQPRVIRKVYKNYDDVDQDYYYDDSDYAYEPVRYVQRPSPRRQVVKRRIYVNNDDYDYDYDYDDDDDEIEYVVEEKPRPVKYVQRPIRRAVYVLEDDEPPQQPQPSPRPQPKPILRQNAKPVSIRRHTIRTPVDNPVPPPAPVKIQSNDHTYVRAMDIILANRAKRGWKLPKPKREVEEEKFHDPPQPNKNIIKNGFIIHK